jgi:TetR/AcrR family transcriptional repressor of nem operon
MPYASDHKEKTRDRILNAATELFSRFSFEKVSIAEIMRNAKMTHGAFYNHFQSKEALFKASFFENLKASKAARLVKGPLSLKHLTDLVTHYWSLRELDKHNKPGPEMVLFNEIGNQNDGIKPLLEESYNSLKKMVETRLLALSKLKLRSFEADKELVAEKARIIVSMLVGAVVVAKSLSQEDERGRLLEATQKQIMVMLGVNHSPVAEEIP